MRWAPCKYASMRTLPSSGVSTGTPTKNDPCAEVIAMPLSASVTFGLSVPADTETDTPESARAGMSVPVESAVDAPLRATVLVGVSVPAETVTAAPDSVSVMLPPAE